MRIAREIAELPEHIAALKPVYGPVRTVVWEGTALFASLTLSLSFCVMKRVMLSITR